MGIVEILKRAWAIAWRYKYLWVLGFFAAAPRVPELSYQSSLGDLEELGYTPPELGAIEPGLIILFIAVTLLVLLVYIVLAVAANAGLVHAVSEADEGRPLGFGDAWGAGFNLWVRVFLMGLVYMSATLLVSVATGVVGFFLVITCCLIPLLFVLVIAVAFLMGSWWELSLRYAVIEDCGVLDALANGGRTLLAEWKQVVVVWLALFGIGLGLGLLLVIPILAVVFAGAGIAAGSSGSAASVGFIVIGVGAIALLAVVPAAIVRTWFSATWTVFFKALTLRPAVESAVAGVPPAPGAHGTPPPPPAASGDAPPPAPSRDAPPPPPRAPGAPSGGS